MNIGVVPIILYIINMFIGEVLSHLSNPLVRQSRDVRLALDCVKAIHLWNRWCWDDRDIMYTGMASMILGIAIMRVIEPRTIWHIMIGPDIVLYSKDRVIQHSKYIDWRMYKFVEDINELIYASMFNMYNGRIPNNFKVCKSDPGISGISGRDTLADSKVVSYILFMAYSNLLSPIKDMRDNPYTDIDIVV